MHLRCETKLVLLAIAACAMLVVPVSLATMTETTDGARLALLIERWHARDASTAVEAGRNLSDFFVKNEALFLNAMLEHPAEWTSWLEELPKHTLTVHAPSTKKQIEKIRRDMRKKAENLERDTRLGELARALASKLKETPVRES